MEIQKYRNNFGQIQLFYKVTNTYARKKGHTFLQILTQTKIQIHQGNFNTYAVANTNTNSVANTNTNAVANTNTNAVANTKTNAVASTNTNSVANTNINTTRNTNTNTKRKKITGGGSPPFPPPFL